ncbi:MAG: kynureninase [Chitinophagales bacterium]|nr:kynureninase [Chitinophagales bacterium]
MIFKQDEQFALQLDKEDELASYRNEFYIPKVNGKESVYFTGNSLGLQCKKVATYIAQELEDWKELGVEGHFHGKNPWFSYHHFLTKPLAKIVGAKENEVVAMNALTVNLNLLMVSFYRPTKQRYKIIMEADAFPSDHYAIQQQVKFHGYKIDDAIVQLYPKENEHTLRTEDIVKTINQHKENLALVLLGGVNYYTGQFFDLKTITEATHNVGALAGYDLAHAVGNVPLKLHDWNVDFATWCSYKYLNSGPGGVSGVYINEKHTKDKDIPRFAGWWGHEEKTRFKMDKTFVPTQSAEAWQMSNAPVLSMAAHKASLELFNEVGMEKLRAKSEKLTAYLEWLILQNNFGFEIITPKNKEERGCQLSLLTGNNGKQLFEKLTKAGVIADWREPNVIRIAPVPLYNSFQDVWRFVEILKS